MSAVDPTTATSQMSKPAPRRRWRYLLTGVGIFAATIALFYLEENWRGRRAWENCQRELLAKGAVLDWSAFLPPPVPDDQNAFAVPEMQKWFLRFGTAQLSAKLSPGVASELSARLNYPGWTNAGRMVVANLTIGQPGTDPASGSAVLPWPNPTNLVAEAARLMKDAIGPMAMDPIGMPLMAKKPEEIRPAQIFLQCQIAPTAKELEEMLPTNLVSEWSIRPEKLRLEPTGSNSYRVTMTAPMNAPDYVAWGKTVEPELSVIHQAVQRPYARVEVNNGDVFGQNPNFVAMRHISQRLAALAKCYMLLGQPEKALEEVTFLNQVRRLMEFRPSGKPMPLVTAMINVAIAGLYVSTIEDGMRLQVWREPQLAALEEQLAGLNLRPNVASALSFERASIIHLVDQSPRKALTTILWPDTDPKTNVVRIALTRLIPEGWIDQNLVVFANLEQLGVEALPQDRQDIEPHKLDRLTPAIKDLASHSTPFNLLAQIGIPNFSRAGQTLAHNQTLIHQAQIVCALERYRLARGEYPAALDALKPQFMEKIPPDLIGGQPPHYHRTDDGKFLLYSIGWTEKDHGGKSSADAAEGDWVWGTE